MSPAPRLATPIITRAWADSPCRRMRSISTCPFCTCLVARYAIPRRYESTGSSGARGFERLEQRDGFSRTAETKLTIRREIPRLQVVGRRSQHASERLHRRLQPHRLVEREPEIQSDRGVRRCSCQRRRYSAIASSKRPRRMRTTPRFDRASMLAGWAVRNRRYSPAAASKSPACWSATARAEGRVLRRRRSAPRSPSPQRAPGEKNHRSTW